MDASAVTGVILAGGRARRLGGVAKGMLEREGRPIVDRIAEALAEVAGDRLLVADDPTPYAALGWPTVPDAFHGIGPAGGLVAALERATTPFVLVVACDMPGVASPVLALLRDRDPRFDVVVPEVGGMPEPLCARWATRAAPRVRSAVGAGVHKMAALLERLVVERLPEAVLRTVDPSLAVTGNVNTPDDAERLGIALGRPRR